MGGGHDSWLAARTSSRSLIDAIGRRRARFGISSILMYCTVWKAGYNNSALARSRSFGATEFNLLQFIVFVSLFARSRSL